MYIGQSQQSITHPQQKDHLALFKLQQDHVLDKLRVLGSINEVSRTLLEDKDPSEEQILQRKEIE